MMDEGLLYVNRIAREHGERHSLCAFFERYENVKSFRPYKVCRSLHIGPSRYYRSEIDKMRRVQDKICVLPKHPFQKHEYPSP